MFHEMDKSEEFFDDTPGQPYNSTRVAIIRDLLMRLKTIANCFRTGFPEMASSNATFNDTLLWETDYSPAWGADDEDGSFAQAIWIVSIFCCVGLLLVIRSSRGGSCTPCCSSSEEEDEAAISGGTTTTSKKAGKTPSGKSASSYQIVPV